MKNILILILCFFLLPFGTIQAQNSEGKADDGGRISLTPQVSDQEIPQGAKNMLLNKMKQICSKNGMSGDGENPFFVMDATIDILSKELTPTAPPMHALNLQINFFIKDVVNNNVYSETSIEIKGVGTNETKAYIAAIKNINTSKGQFKALVDRGKTKILEFYNSDCDFIISKAKALQKQGSNGEAIKVLKSVPKVCLECYDKCMAILSEIEPPVEPEKTESALSSDGGSGSSSAMGSGAEQEIEDNVFLVYMGGKQIGDKTLLNFEFQNRGSKDYEFNDYAMDTRAVDANGDEFNVESVSVAGVVGSRSIATIIQGTPVKMECQFAKMDAISMFEFKYKGKVFRIKNISISTGASIKADVSAEAKPMGSATIAVGSKIFVDRKKSSEFRWKEYSPGKIKTLASDATKGEFEIMAMGDCSSDVIWTKDIITQWHQATKDNIKEGMTVLYTNGGAEMNETVCYGIAKVIAVDELYKDLVTLKGYGDNIRKRSPNTILIIDKSNIKL
ncbi:MAG: hypothetical protein JEZ09_18695 [Salinivirgaceae bacterium]|nr:hypothetical protein [Salinivirgaceae bacterium]